MNNMGIRCRSINRAAKRGHFIDMNGCYAVERPFNNRKNTSKGRHHSRRESEYMRKIWRMNKLKSNDNELQQETSK